MQRIRHLSISESDLITFCQRWQIKELALFGSALRTDFGPESDIDLLATFAPGAQWTLFDHMRMELELVELFGHEVDLIDHNALLNSAHPQRKAEILNTAQIIFSASETAYAVRS